MTELMSLPAEIRRMILIAALYRTYEPEEFKSALRNSNPSYSVFVEADIKLGQQTLSALKLTCHKFHDEAAAASEVWLKYLMIDLIDELEAIRARFLRFMKKFPDPGSWNSAVCTQADHRFVWIAQMEISSVRYHQQRLAFAREGAWKKDRVYEDGVCEFLTMCERPPTIEQEVQPRTQTSLERQTVVCFGPAKPEALEVLRRGLPAGVIGIYGDPAYHLEIEQQKRKIHGRKAWLKYIDGDEKVRWQEHGWLPNFYYGSDETEWWRPYKRIRSTAKNMPVA